MIRNGRKVDEIWRTFAKIHGLRLSEKERKYFQYGLTHFSFAEEQRDDFNIRYCHRFELPTNAARGELLTIEFRSRNLQFLRTEVKQPTFINRFLGFVKLRIESEGRLDDVLLERTWRLYKTFPYSKISAQHNQVTFDFLNFPDSVGELSKLRALVIDLTVDLRKWRCQQHYSQKLPRATQSFL